MEKEQYEKLKSKNKAQFKLGCVTSFNQELAEIQTKHPHVLDFYFAEHHGLWILRSSNDDWDLAEYDTKSDMLLELGS